MTDNILHMINNDTNKNVVNKRVRPHSNTISGGRPPALDITISRPINVRRNSEGSPGLPPPICISEPTPIEPSSNHDGFFNNKTSTNSSSANTSRPATPNLDNAPPPPPVQPKVSTTAPVGGAGLLYSPPLQKKSRSRASSITSNLINEIKESSTMQSLASKIKSRHSEDADDSDFGATSAPGSVAAASGVSLAKEKKNSEFHALFRSVPEEDNLIEDFGCALQKEILLQGRIYVSENHICFNANIFGWVTNLVIAFDDIIEIEKKSTAYFIPNAIQISTDSAKHFFASFLSRDQAYDLMVDMWRIARPDLMPGKDGDSVQIDEDGSSDLSGEEEDSVSYYDSDTEDSYTEDESDVENVAVANSTAAVAETNGNRPRKVSIASLPPAKESKDAAAARRRAMSEAPRPNFQADERATPAKSNTPPIDSKYADAADKSAAEKPQVHEKSECQCESSGTGHFPNIVSDQIYPGSVEGIYNILFDSDFMKKFLVENQKSLELNLDEWKKGEGDVKLVREMSYIKQLGGAIGPKQTKCYITQEVFEKDFDKSASVLTTTYTPDVPSGGSFSCKTRTCITWAGKGKVRVFVSVLVDFTKSSWLKSTIEKASIDGQQTYYKELDAAIRTHLKENGEISNGSGAKGDSTSRRRRKGKKSRRSRSPKPELKEVKSDKPESAVHQVLSAISNAIADGITAVIDVVRSPNASHLTLLCLIAMIFINIFIARKMAYVEEQLGNLSKLDGKMNDVVEEMRVIPGVQQRREYTRQEEEDLWDWLGHIDPDKSNQVREQVIFPSNIEDEKDQEAVWDDAIKSSKAAKERLEKHMIELTNMIQKAESNLEQVTKDVNEQRQKIKQDD